MKKHNKIIGQMNRKKELSRAAVAANRKVRKKLYLKACQEVRSLKWLEKLTLMILL